MSEQKKAALDQLIESLKQQRDTLALQIHLGKAEAKDEWERTIAKLDELTRDYDPVKQAVGQTTEDVLHSLSQVAKEVKLGFDRIHDSLK